MITKLELIEYLKHTPENTNYNILRSGLYNGSNKEAVDEFIEVLSRGNLSLAALQPYLAKLYEDDKTISPEPLPPFSSGGSVPKPLTYDYMPEGYPKKAVQTVTLMEEQALAFADMSGSGPYAASLTNAFEIAVGQTYTVNWDGAKYECVGATLGENRYALGNMSIAGVDADTGEPFIYVYDTDRPEAGGMFGTLDTSASHTISVKGIVETVTPMAEEFLPETLATKLDVEVAQTAANATQATANAAQTTADNAQTTANAAQTTAENAQTTANAAQTTAENAQTTANNAKTAADDALLAANTAKNAANNAKTTAENAQTTADAAQTKVAQALTINSSGYIAAPTNAMDYGTYQTLKLNSKDSYHSSSFGVTESIGLQILVGRDGGFQSNVSNPSTVEFKSNGGSRVRLKGIDELILKSSTTDSAKKFKITVDDTGTLSATEVT